MGKNIVCPKLSYLITATSHIVLCVAITVVCRNRCTTEGIVYINVWTKYVTLYYLKIVAMLVYFLNSFFPHSMVLCRWNSLETQSIMGMGSGQNSMSQEHSATASPHPARTTTLQRDSDT